MAKRLFDPLGSSGSACVSDIDYDAYAMDSSDEDDEGISFTTTESKCERLFEQGLELKLSGEIEEALPCFLDCLKGMQECQYFAKLPQTLHNLGELYRSLGSYDNALEFAQAEKLFYEAVLVSSASSTKDRSTRTKRKPFGRRKTTTKSSGSNPAEYGDLLIKKANEYEMLAKICAKEKKYDLAVDYSGKAAKLKRSVYGLEHPDTVASMENFSLLYAELGRAEYATALKQAESVRTEQPQEPHTESVKTEEVLESSPDPATSATIIQERLPEPAHTPNGHSEATNTSLQDTRMLAHSSEYKQISHTEFPVQGNENELHSYSPNAEQTNTDNAILSQACTVVENTTHSSLINDIHWSKDPDNGIHEGEGLEVCIHKPELNIEHSRFCPLWVLLLGAFLEMALVAYVVYLR